MRERVFQLVLAGSRVRMGARDLAARVHELNSQAVRARGDELRAAVRLGAVLIQVRPQLPHGKWISWLHANGVKHNHAKRAVNLAARYADSHGELDEPALVAAIDAFNAAHAGDGLGEAIRTPDEMRNGARVRHLSIGATTGATPDEGRNGARVRHLDRDSRSFATAEIAAGLRRPVLDGPIEEPIDGADSYARALCSPAYMPHIDWRTRREVIAAELGEDEAARVEGEWAERGAQSRSAERRAQSGEWRVESEGEGEGGLSGVRGDVGVPSSSVSVEMSDCSSSPRTPGGMDGAQGIQGGLRRHEAGREPAGGRAAGRVRRGDDVAGQMTMAELYAAAERLERFASRVREGAIDASAMMMVLAALDAVEMDEEVVVESGEAQQQ